MVRCLNAKEISILLTPRTVTAGIKRPVRAHVKDTNAWISEPARYFFSNFDTHVKTNQKMACFLFPFSYFFSKARIIAICNIKKKQLTENSFEILEFLLKVKKKFNRLTILLQGCEHRRGSSSGL